MLYTLWTVFRKSWKKHNFLQWHKLCPLCENVSLVISMGIGSEKVSVFSPLQLTSMCSYHKRYWTLHLLITSPLLHFLYALCPFLFLRRNKQKLVSFVFSMLISIHAAWKVYCYFSRFTMQKTDGRAPSFSRQQYECIGVTSENDFFSVAARQKHRLSSSYWLFSPPPLPLSGGQLIFGCRPILTLYQPTAAMLMQTDRSTLHRRERKCLWSSNMSRANEWHSDESPRIRDEHFQQKRCQDKRNNMKAISL